MYQFYFIGDNDFDFTCLLHTYVRVPDISKVTVSNLKGLTYVDKVFLFTHVARNNHHFSHHEIVENQVIHLKFMT